MTAIAKEGDETKLKKYRCIKRFYLDSYDGNGFVLNEEGLVVDRGSTWILQEDSYRFIDGEIRLEQEDGTWIELSKETFAEIFKEII